MFNDFDQSTSYDTSSVISVSQNKDYYKKNKISGVYKEYDPVTGELIEEGQFQNGVEVGLWKVIDQDGDQQHFRFSQERIGARCGDGSFSSATGRGACSWHGGVAEWLYDNKRYQAGGTGKYEPIQQKLKKTKIRLRDELKLNINKNDQQLLVQVAAHLFKQNLNPEIQQKKLEEKISLKIQAIKSECQGRVQKMEEIQQFLESENSQLKQQIQELNKKLTQNTQKQEEKIAEIKIQHNLQLEEKQNQIALLKKELELAKSKKEKNKKKLQMSISRSQIEKNEIKNQIKFIQKQLAVLNETIEQKTDLNQTVRESIDSDFSDSENEKTQFAMKKNSSILSSQKQHLLKAETDPKETKKSSEERSSKEQKKVQSLNKSQQSEISSDKNDQISSNDSLSYEKILNSKLFKVEQNLSDISMFVDLKPKNKDDKLFEKKPKKILQKQESKHQKSMYRFKPEEQSSDEENDEGLNSEEEAQSNENYEIFKSIPFKNDVSEIKSKGDKSVKDKK